MTRRLGSAIAITTIALAVTTLAAQMTTVPGSGPAPTGIVVGQVVDAGTGKPLAGVTVALTALPGALSSMAGGNGIGMDQLMSLDFGNLFAGIHQVLTDGQGRFAFTDLPKATFEFTARKPGWTGGGYGQKRVDGPPKPFVLADSEHAGNVTLQMWKFAALGGTVVDEAGEPVVGLAVRAMRRTWTSGKAHLAYGGAAQTDDRGVYRIATLTPGEFIVVIPQTLVTVPASGPAPAMDSAALQALISSGAAGRDPATMLATISSLSPNGGGGIRMGEWTLQTSGLGGRIVPPVITDGKMAAYRTTFYPAASASAQAAPITLGSGDDRSGLDFQLRPVPVARVSGTATGSDGPLGGIGVRLLPGGTDDGSPDSEVETATTTTNPNGAFTFLGVPSGQYTLRILRTPKPAAAPATTPRPNVAMIQNGSGGTTMSMGALTMDMVMPLPPPLPTEPTLWATVPVSVGDADLLGLAVTLRPGFRVSGRIEFDGTTIRPTPDQLRRMAISIDRADVAGASANPLAGLTQMPRGQVDANGQFTTPGLVPGKYFIRVPLSIAGWTLKSAILGGRDLADVPFDLDNGDVGGVVLTLTDRTAELSGAAHTAQGAADPDASIILFATDPATWSDFGSTPRRLRLVRTAKDGHYAIAGVPPGEYFVAAVSDDVAGDWQNAKFLEGLSRMATRVTIGDGEKKTQDVITH